MANIITKNHQIHEYLVWIKHERFFPLSQEVWDKGAQRV